MKLFPLCPPFTLAAALLPTLFAFGIAEQRPPTKTPDIHFVPTPPPIADAMLKLAQVTPQDVVYDLGSGDGRIVILAAQKYGAHGVGIELDARLVEISRQVAREGKVDDRVTFLQGDLFAADISKATVVAIWLSNDARRVPVRIESELPVGRFVLALRQG